MSEERAEYQVEGATQGKPLRCPGCRRVLGFVRRERGIRTLRLEAEGLAVEVSMDARVECGCGGLLYWHAGQEAIDELVSKVIQRGDAERG